MRTSSLLRSAGGASLLGVFFLATPPAFAQAQPLGDSKPAGPSAPDIAADFALLAKAIAKAQNVESPMGGTGQAFTAFKGDADAPAASLSLDAALADAGPQAVGRLWEWIRASGSFNAKGGEPDPVAGLTESQRATAVGAIGAMAWNCSQAAGHPDRIQRLTRCAAATQRLGATGDPGYVWNHAQLSLRLQLAVMLNLAAAAPLDDADLKRLAAAGLLAFDRASRPWESLKVSVNGEVRHLKVHASRYRDDPEINRVAREYLSAIERAFLVDVPQRRAVLYAAAETVPQDVETKLNGLAFSDRLLDVAAQNQTLASLLVLACDARIARRAAGVWSTDRSSEGGRGALRDYVHGRDIRSVAAGDSLILTTDLAAPSGSDAQKLFFSIEVEFQGRIDRARSISLTVAP